MFGVIGYSLMTLLLALWIQNTSSGKDYYGELHLLINFPSNILHPHGIWGHSPTLSEIFWLIRKNYERLFQKSTWEWKIS